MKRLLTVSLFLLFTLPASANPLCTNAELNQLTRGLTFTTALEKPVQPFIYRGLAAERFMQRVKALEDRVCQPTRTFEEEVDWLLDPYCDHRCEGDDWDEATQRRLDAVVAYMRANLTDLQTAFFGEEPEFEVYVFGRDRCGNIVGVRMVEVT